MGTRRARRQSGQCGAWIDGNVHRMSAGDLAAFPPGTGISHCFISSTDRDAVLLVGGDAPKHGSRVFYPLNPSRRSDMDPSSWREDVPKRELGLHNGLPDAAPGAKSLNTDVPHAGPRPCRGTRPPFTLGVTK